MKKLTALLTILVSMSILFGKHYFRKRFPKGFENKRIEYDITKLPNTPPDHAQLGAFNAIKHFSWQMGFNEDPFICVYLELAFVTGSGNEIKYGGDFSRKQNTPMYYENFNYGGYNYPIDSTVIYLNEKCRPIFRLNFSDTVGKVLSIPILLQHEICHSAGLGHIDTSYTGPSIMFPKPYEDAAFKWGYPWLYAEDIWGLACIYGYYSKKLRRKPGTYYNEECIGFCQLGGIYVSAPYCNRAVSLLYHWARCSACGRWSSTFPDSGAILWWYWRKMFSQDSYDKEYIKDYTHDDVADGGEHSFTPPGYGVEGYFTLEEPETMQELARSEIYYIWGADPRFAPTHDKTRQTHIRLKPAIDILLIQDKDRVHLYVPARGEVIVHLYNLLGRVQLERKSFGSGERVYFSFNKKKLKQGTYFLLIKRNSGISSKKVMIKK